MHQTILAHWSAEQPQSSKRYATRTSQIVHNNTLICNLSINTLIYILLLPVIFYMYKLCNRIFSCFLLFHDYVAVFIEYSNLLKFLYVQYLCVLSGI